MAASQGYGKAVTSGSVFAYDVADTINSFKGQPKTNLLTAISKAGVSDSTFFKTNSGTEIVNIPNIGNRTVHYVNIYNDYYGGSGNCCPSPMYFGDFSVSPSTVYTYQIIYKTTTGYAHPNYMYHYEFNGGTYVTEYGLWDSSRQESLGDGWAHAWGTFTSNASTNRFITYLFHYEYGVWNKIQVAGIMLTQGNNIIPPRQFLDINGTRSATQGLLPLVSNSTLDLSNVSFNTNGQITFDGSNDKIDTDITNIVNNASYEVVLNCKGNVSTYNMYMGQYLPYMGVYGGNTIYYSDYINGSQTVVQTNSGTITYDTYYHVICTREYDGSNTTQKVYINGNLLASGTFSGAKSAFFNPNTISIGDGASFNWYPFYGDIPIAKVYNRALTLNEIKQNYNKYKTRFNLS